MTIRKNKINWVQFAIFFAFMIVATSFFNYKNWSFKTYIYLPFYAYFIIEWYIHRGRLHKERSSMHFSKLIKWLIAIPFLCFISYFANGDLGWRSHPTTFIMMCGSVAYLAYYAFHAAHVNEKTLVSVFIALALCMFAIQVIQQFNPDAALFGVKRDFTDETETLNKTDFIEERNGLYRFRLIGTAITILALCYSWQKFLKRRNVVNALMFLVFAASIYLTLTRQQMVAAIGMCVFSVFFMGKSRITTRFKYLFPILIVLFLIYSFRDALFGSLLEQTQDQAEEAESNVRTLAFAYYWNEIVSHPLTFLFGAGGNSAAAARASDMFLYWVDIGLIGQWFAWGIGAIISYIYILYQILIKKAGQVPPYVKFFVFMTFITSILIYPYRSPSEFFIWASLFYICDLHISESPLRLKS